VRVARAAGSLTRRVALLAALWVAAGLALTGWFVTGLAGRHIVAGSDARLAAAMDAVVAAVDLDATGRPRLERLPPDSEFERPLSGRYWQVTGPGGFARSRSLWDEGLPVPAVAAGAAAVRDAAGPRGEALRLLERRVELPGSARTILVQVAAPLSETAWELARLRRGIALAFGILGTGLVAGIVLQVVWAMRPLRAARAAVNAVRGGAQEQLGLAAPSEIAPLVEEVDALIAQNRATVERARAHVGNLAHALKTPAAVLRNALDQVDGPGAAVAREQAAEVERILRHHLARARAAALAGGAGAGFAGARSVAEEVAAALRRLPEERGPVVIAVQGDALLRVRTDRQDLVEMLGNLMENARRWARSRVEVHVGSDGRMAVLEVEDDGLGLPNGQDAAATARGVRLDEAMPGTGLGLAIVDDLAGLHGGRLVLAPSTRLGGLSARLELPIAVSVAAERAGA
jgi:signal transduction histidine kinase